MSAPTILLVDDDETLSRVLRRVLMQQGYNVVEAASVARALQAARDTPPQLGLLDLRLPDGDGVELAKRLVESGATFPVLLMTAYPLRLRDQPDLARQFARVLTKPLNLQELRQAIEAALAHASVAAPVTLPRAAPAPVTHSETSVRSETVLPAPVPTTGARRRRWLLAAVCVLLAAGLGTLSAFGIVPIPGWHKPDEAASGNDGQPSAALGAALADDDPQGLVLPEAVVKRLDIATEPAQAAATSRPLRLSGFVNYDPDHMQRVHALFGGKIIEIATVDENVRGVTEKRTLSFNDRVREGDLLAVVWSRDLGQMKGVLVDAQVHLLFDQETLKSYESLYVTGGLAESALRGQRATVAADRNTAATAELALQVAEVPDDEIAAIKAEAQKIFERGGKRDTTVQKNWSRVEVHARMSGTIVEKNIVVGDTVDTSTDLFRIADLNKLTVWASAYEEDLHDLNRLTLPYPWRVQLAADARPDGRSEEGKPLNSRFFEKITPAIDPNQHTATLMGRIEPDSSQKGFVGRMVTATINLPQSGNTVSVPVSSLDEDGETSVVFVQPYSGKNEFSLRRVDVVQRLSDSVLVRMHAAEAGKAAAEGARDLKPGDLVVTRQAYLLRSALEDLQSRAKGQANKASGPTAASARQ